MNPHSLKKNGRAILAISAALALAACASPPEPKEQLAVANAAVDTATGNAAEAPAELATLTVRSTDIPKSLGG